MRTDRLKNSEPECRMKPESMGNSASDPSSKNQLEGAVIFGVSATDWFDRHAVEAIGLP
jgi:hypothetical protein